MKRASTAILWSLGTLLLLPQVGCVNYGALATAQRNNIDYLWRLEVCLSHDDESSRVEFATKYPNFASLSAEARQLALAELSAVRQVMLDRTRESLIRQNFASAWARAAFRSQAAILGGATAPTSGAQAEIQRRLYEEIDATQTQVDEIMNLHGKMLQALAALRNAGFQNLDYFEMSRFGRLFTDVEGLDRDKLKQIGEDLEAVGRRLKPRFEDLLSESGR